MLKQQGAAQSRLSIGFLGVAFLLHYTALLLATSFSALTLQTTFNNPHYTMSMIHLCDDDDHHNYGEYIHDNEYVCNMTPHHLLVCSQMYDAISIYHQNYM